nr:MAG TPA: hypothetical protein [Caudoviricetes sp.]
MPGDGADSLSEGEIIPFSGVSKSGAIAIILTDDIVCFTHSVVSMVLHCPFTNVVLRCNFTEGHHSGTVRRPDDLPVRLAHASFLLK